MEYVQMAGILETLMRRLMVSGTLLRARGEASMILSSSMVGMTLKDDPTDDEVSMAAALVLRHMQVRLICDETGYMDEHLILNLGHWVFNHSTDERIVHWLKEEFGFERPLLPSPERREVDTSGKVVTLFP